jgi:hypothetical protein
LSGGKRPAGNNNSWEIWTEKKEGFPVLLDVIMSFRHPGELK